jgi:hypothetical protein
MKDRNVVEAGIKDQKKPTDDYMAALNENLMTNLGATASSSHFERLGGAQLGKLGIGVSSFSTKDDIVVGAAPKAKAAAKGKAKALEDAEKTPHKSAKQSQDDSVSPGSASGITPNQLKQKTLKNALGDAARAEGKARQKLVTLREQATLAIRKARTFLETIPEHTNYARVRQTLHLRLKALLLADGSCSAAELDLWSAASAASDQATPDGAGAGMQNEAGAKTEAENSETTPTVTKSTAERINDELTRLIEEHTDRPLWSGFVRLTAVASFEDELINQYWSDIQTSMDLDDANAKFKSDISSYEEGIKSVLASCTHLQKAKDEHQKDTAARAKKIADTEAAEEKKRLSDKDKAKACLCVCLCVGPWSLQRVSHQSFLNWSHCLNSSAGKPTHETNGQYMV